MKKYNVCSKMWTDLNINFQRKTFQHCCKQTHTPISIEDLELLEHNVFQKHPVILQDRKISLNENKLPPNCKWCIDTAPNNIMKVWNIWSDEWVDENRTRLHSGSYIGYIDLDIGKSCDLACIYCGPWSSTTWAKELDQPVDNGIDAEWKEKVLENLSLYISYMNNDTKLVFNILGGEPLLITDTYDIISFLARNCKHFDHKPDLMITTNLNCKPALLKKLLNTIDETRDIFNWIISVSIEDVGSRAEAVRYRIDFNRFENNLKLIKDKVGKIYLTTTFSLFSFPNFHEFIEWSFDIMGQQNYTNSWDYSLNNVQQGYTDLAYCPKELVDVDLIKETFIKKTTYCENKDKVQQVLNHIDNMFNRAGSMKIDDRFIGWWTQLSQRRNLDYKQIYPLNKMV